MKVLHLIFFSSSSGIFSSDGDEGRVTHGQPILRGTHAYLDILSIFAPFLFSMFSFFVIKMTAKRRCCNDSDDGQENTRYYSNWDFFWQIPLIQLIRHFTLWRTLWKELKKKATVGGNDKELMTIFSKIQTFRMYQTFCEGIPGFVIRLSLVSANEKIDSTKELFNLYLPHFDHFGSIDIMFMIFNVINFFIIVIYIHSEEKILTPLPLYVVKWPFLRG